MVTLEEWLQDVPALALKELAGGPSETHGMSKPAVIKYILAHEDAREMCEESKRIEEGILASIAARGESPTEVWAKKFLLPYR